MSGWLTGTKAALGVSPLGIPAAAQLGAAPRFLQDGLAPCWHGNGLPGWQTLGSCCAVCDNLQPFADNPKLLGADTLRSKDRGGGGGVIDDVAVKGPGGGGRW